MVAGGLGGYVIELGQSGQQFGSASPRSARWNLRLNCIFRESHLSGLRLLGDALAQIVEDVGSQKDPGAADSCAAHYATR